MRWKAAARLAAKILTATLALVGAAVVTATTTGLDSWWATKLAGPWTDPTGDVLIILGGSSYGDGALGESSYLRTLYGSRAFRQGGFRRVVVSGGGNPPVALAMRDYLEALGIPAGTIVTETQSTSTRENALYCKLLLAGMPGRKVLLTSDYHMLRAHRAFSKVGVEVLPRPFPDARKRAARWMARWSVFQDLAVETIKIAYYRARGWI